MAEQTGPKDHPQHAHKGEGCCGHQREASAHIAKDPVCGMDVDPHTAKHRANHAGRTYYFCSAGCRTKFVADPEKYLGKPKPRRPPFPKARSIPARCIRKSARTAPAPARFAAWRSNPSSSPPKPTQSRTRGHVAPPLDRLGAGDPRRSFSKWAAIFLGSASPDHARRLSNWLQLVLATPVVLWAGWPFFERGWKSLVTRNLNMFTLIALGHRRRLAYSVVATLFPDLFPARFAGSDGAVPVYFEAAAVITVLVLVGQVLELRAREQTGGAIRALLNLAPKTARRLQRRRQRGRNSDRRVSVGDRLRVRPGETHSRRRRRHRRQKRGR